MAVILGLGLDAEFPTSEAAARAGGMGTYMLEHQHTCAD
jgi:hypothetical protein